MTETTGVFDNHGNVAKINPMSHRRFNSDFHPSCSMTAWSRWSFCPLVTVSPSSGSPGRQGIEAAWGLNNLRLKSCHSQTSFLGPDGVRCGSGFAEMPEFVTTGSGDRSGWGLLVCHR